MKRALLFATWLLTSAAAQQPEREVPVAEEPMHHLVIDNQYTRVFQVEVPAGKSTMLHRHDHDYVYVVLGDAEIENTPRGKPPVTVKLKEAESRFAAGGFAHSVRNLGSTPFRNVAIEVLKRGDRQVCGNFGGQSAIACKPDPEMSGPGYTWTPLLETDAVKMIEVLYQAGATTPHHCHSVPHLVVPLNDGALRSQPEGKAAVNLRQRTGDPVFVPAGLCHTMANTGTEAVHAVYVEFK